MTSQLHLREFDQNDVSGLIKLWNEEAEWGEISEEKFEKWYLKNPHGESIIIVATDDSNEIVGQLIFMPSVFIYRGQPKKALRFLAPILRKSHRLQSGSPIRDMFRYGAAAAASCSYSLIYAFPAFVFYRTSRILNLPEINQHLPTVDALNCYELDLSDCLPKDSAVGLKAEIVEIFSAEYDDLWHFAAEQLSYECSIARTSDWLRWKLGARLTVAVRDQANRLIGYVAIDTKTSQIIDALARTRKDLKTVFESAIRFLVENPEFNFQSVKLMETSATAGIIEQFGFRKIDFKFAFWRYALDQTIDQNHLHISNWYIMPND